MASPVPEGAACAPNMSRRARALRVRAAWASSVATVIAFVVATALGWAWWARGLSVLVPALVASASYFEARSNVCVLRAAEGTFEHDDRSRTAMEASLLPAIRRVAGSVIIKGVAVALALSVVLTALSLLLVA